MFCSRCGRQNDDKARFCAACGLSLEPFVTEAESEEPVDVTAASGEQVFYKTNPILQVVKSVAGSPLFLVAVITYTASLLFGMLSEGIETGIARNFLYWIQYNTNINIPREIYDILVSAPVRGGVWDAFADSIEKLPAIAICVGLWMIYFTGINKKNPAVSSAGITLIKAMQIVKLVVYSSLTVLVAMIYVLIAVLYFASGYAYAGVSAVILIVGILLLLFALLEILFFVKTIGSLSAVKNSMAVGHLCGKVSLFVGVMLIIGFVCGFFESLSYATISVITYGSLGMGVAGGFTALANAVASVLFAAVLFKTRAKFKHIK